MNSKPSRPVSIKESAKLGARLKEAREKKGYSVKQLADMMGFSVKTVTSWEEKKIMSIRMDYDI